MADSYSQPHISGSSAAPLSEPPDIRNWFPSYKYESFVLDTCENFGFSESNGTESCADGQDKLGDFKEPRKIDENCNEGPNSSKMLDSLQWQPVLSEPPDIGNWYSSYVYESPEIHTSDGFTNFALEDNERLKDSQVTRDISKEKVEKCGGSPLIVNSSELAVLQSGLTTGVVTCNGSSTGEGQHESESLSKVMDFSESPSLSSVSISEPPHIRNWFPDYISECSVPVASDGVDVSLCKVREFEEDTFADGENNLEEAPIIATTRDAARPTVSDNVDKMEFEYTHSIVEDSEERETMTKVERKEDHFNQGTAFLRKTSELGLETKTLHETEKNSKEAVYDSSLSKEGLSKTPKYDISSNAEPESLATDINTRKCDGKVLEKLKSEVLTERSSLAEDVCQPTKCVPDHNASGVGLSRTPIQGTGIRESEEISEDGFIMTKKRKILKKAGKENSLKPPEDTLFPCSRSKGSNKSEFGNVEGVERKVLAETTNVQCLEANAVMGKWRCPQKSKPYRGPPMRQLRLEQWVHKL